LQNHRKLSCFRNKKQKYNDLSTEDELSEIEFLEVQPKSPVKTRYDRYRTNVPSPGKQFTGRAGYVGTIKTTYTMARKLQYFTISPSGYKYKT